MWPPHIAGSAFLALDEMPLLDGTGADGAPAGRFVLRNAFGPRVLAVWLHSGTGIVVVASRVILNGVDVTNASTDFSAYENAQLEIVFTRHPARIAGTVTDTQGQSVRAPWVLVTEAERALRQRWATTTNVTQGDTMGRFSLPARPGTGRSFPSRKRKWARSSWRVSLASRT
jgi:hypothetical protein